VLAADGSVVINVPIGAALPVDVAVSPDGSSYAVVAPGNAFSAGLSTVLTFDRCGKSSAPGQSVGTGGVSEQPIAVAYDAAGDVLVQTREPAALWILGATSDANIPLSTVSRADTGSDIFHTQAGAMIACASCHPEGRDDGHVWLLNGDKRRTPSLRGTIAGTAPYHWPGDEPDLNVLVNDVYTIRMDGASLSTDQMGAITGWVQNVPPPPAPSWVDAASAQRGKGLFESAAAACSTCHSGSKLTNNLTMDVGTGGSFQVPPLVGVGWRTPLMHDGCAATLADRFGACATPTHGSTGALTSGDVADLVSYLETL
jgi:cytochrome c553